MNIRDTSIRLGQIELPRVDFVKFLGMWIDQKLTLNEHLSKLKLKLRRNMTVASRN